MSSSAGSWLGEARESGPLWPHAGRETAKVNASTANAFEAIIPTIATEAGAIIEDIGRDRH